MGSGGVGRRALLRSVGVVTAAGLAAPEATRAASANSRPGRPAHDAQETAEDRTGTAWPMSGFGAANTRYSPSADPPTGGVAVAFDADVAAATPPAVLGGRAFVGSPEGEVFALDASSGTPLWRFPTAGGAPTAPAVDGDLVFVGDGGANLHALDAARGDQRWIASRDGIGEAPPVVAGGRVYVATANAVFAFRPSDGSLRWVSGSGGGAAASPTVTDDEVVVGGATLDAIDPDDGDRRWRFEPDGRRVRSPAVAGRTVFAAGTDAVVYAVDARTGAERWRLANGASGSPPAVADGVVYAGGGRSIHALDAITGERFWSFAGEGDGWSAPAVAGRTVLAWNVGDRLYALDRCTGAVRWSATWPGRSGQPVVAGGAVYVGSPEGTFALVPGSRRVYSPRSYGGFEPSWSYQPGSQLVRGVVVDGDVALVATEAGFGGSERRVHAIDVSDGTRRWTTPGGSWIPRPAIAAGTVPVTTGPTSIAGVDVATGAERWTFGTDRELLFPTAVVGSSVIVPGSSGRVRAFHGATREPHWTADLAIAGLLRHGSGRLYLTGAVDPIGEERRQVVALDATTGAVAWASEPSTRIDGIPEVVGDTVYGTGIGGHVTALSAVAGERRWYRNPAPSGTVVASRDGVFLLGRGGTLYGLDPETGATAWTVETGADGAAPVVAADGTVLVGAGGDLSAFEAESGTLRWRVHRDGADWSPPAVADGFVYVADGGGRLYALDASDGTVLGWYDASEQVRRPLVHDGRVYAGLFALFAIPTASVRSTDDGSLGTGDGPTTDACERASRRTAAPTTATSSPDGSPASSDRTGPGNGSPPVDGGGASVGSPGFGPLAAVTGLAAGALSVLRRGSRGEGTDGSSCRDGGSGPG